MTEKIRCWQVDATDLAIKVSRTPPERGEQGFVWLPKSQLEHISREGVKHPGDWIPCTITMPTWLAERANLI